MLPLAYLCPQCTTHRSSAKIIKKNRERRSESEFVKTKKKTHAWQQKRNMNGKHVWHINRLHDARNKMGWINWVFVGAKCVPHTHSFLNCFFSGLFSTNNADSIYISVNNSVFKNQRARFNIYVLETNKHTWKKKF